MIAEPPNINPLLPYACRVDSRVFFARLQSFLRLFLPSPAADISSYVDAMNDSNLMLQATRSSPRTQQAVRKLADSAEMIVWMTDVDDVCVYLNESVKALFQPDDEIDISAWMQFIHPEDRARTLPVLLQAKQNRTEYRLEYRIIRSDGSIRWMMGMGAPRFSESGEFAGFTGTIVDVSERYAMMEKLANRQATYRLLTDNASDLISRHAADGAYLYASPSCERILGHTYEQLLGKNACDTLYPDDRQLIEEEIRRQLGGADGLLLDMRARHANGSEIWLGTKLQVLTDPATGAYLGVVAVSRDITAERAAQEALRLREERFRSLTSLCSDWYWETDTEGRFTFVSDGLLTLGVTPEQVLGKTRDDLADDPQQAGLITYKACIAQRKPFKDLPFSGRPPDGGTLRHTLVSGEPVYDKGEFKGYRGVSSDITEQAAKTTQLQQLAAENHALIENSPDMIILADAEGKLLRVNEASLNIVGYRPEELLTMNYSRFVHPDDLQETQRMVEHASANRAPLQDYENRWIRKDGSVAYLSWSLQWSADSEVMYCVARDVGERHVVRQARIDAIERLHRVLESIGDGFFTVDRNWRVTYVNRIAAEFFGLAREEFIGMRMWSAVPSILDSPFLGTYRRAMEHGETASFEAYHPARKAWLDMRLYPHTDGISVFFSNVTEKREAAKALWLSEQRLREVLMMTPAAYILADANCVLTDLNPALCELSGYAEAELVGRPLAHLFGPELLASFMAQGPHAGELQGVEGIIRHKRGHLVYVLANAHMQRDGAGELLSTTAFLTDITARKLTEIKTKQIATHDRLTGLPNRVYLDEALPGILDYAARGRTNAILYIDLDGFKQVNDALGHAAGDELLFVIARRMRQETRQSDIVARLGGDEFVVVAQCSEGAASARTIAEKLLAAIGEPIDLHGQQVSVGASIGISLWPHDGTTRDELFAKADSAMYAIKTSGRNGYRFYGDRHSVDTAGIAI